MYEYHGNKGSRRQQEIKEPLTLYRAGGFLFISCRRYQTDHLQIYSGGVRILNVQLAQIFEETAEQLRCQDGRSFYEIWQMSVERHWKELLLTTEECREWKEFGRHLGFMDLEMQEKNMELYLEQLELSVRFYREQEREQQKLSISLGIMGGLFLTVLLF